MNQSQRGVCKSSGTDGDREYRQKALTLKGRIGFFIRLELFSRIYPVMLKIKECHSHIQIWKVDEKNVNDSVQLNMTASSGGSN